MEITGELLQLGSVEEWRAWLEEHHAGEDGVWLTISKKGASTPSVPLVPATEEALCFGWIDSAMHPIDDERYALRYTPRRKGSNWSAVNRARAQRLIEEGRMTHAGLAAIEEAKRNGRWNDAGEG
ncbi:MAG TPA: hypothetical protein VF195_04425 [Actinomycetota bacterium]